jgi:hypothetical protein
MWIQIFFGHRTQNPYWERSSIVFLSAAHQVCWSITTFSSPTDYSTSRHFAVLQSRIHCVPGVYVQTTWRESFSHWKSSRNFSVWNPGCLMLKPSLYCILLLSLIMCSSNEFCWSFISFVQWWTGNEIHLWLRTHLQTCLHLMQISTIAGFSYNSKMVCVYTHIFMINLAVLVSIPEDPISVWNLPTTVR